MNDPILRTENLNVYYGDFLALRGVTMAIPPQKPEFDVRKSRKFLKKEIAS